MYKIGVGTRKAERRLVAIDIICSHRKKNKKKVLNIKEERGESREM
jgi:hypothetical protein